MKKQAGFTLVEVMVGMLVTMLIMGALVSLFSSSVKSELSGFKQQEVYAQARAAVNDLKTTLRYANAAAVFYDTSGKKISDPTYNNTKTANKVIYSATVYDSSAGENKSVKMTIEWLNTDKKQVKITKEVDSKTTETIFPKSADNSAFADYESIFPITINKNDSELYHINLPYKYAFAGSGTKSDALVTDVLKGADATAGSGMPPILLTGGDLTFVSTNGKIRTETEDVTLVLKAQNANGLNNGNWSSSKFKVLTNNSSIKNNSGKIELVESYDGLDIDDVISKYSRITGTNEYKFPKTINPDTQELKTYPSFSFDEAKKVGKVLWNSGSGSVTINGTNAVFSINEVALDGNNVSFALSNGKENGALILYSKSQISLVDLNIPSNIAVLICAESQVTITNCTLNNCIVLAKGGNCNIEKSNIYGMVESSGSALQIEGKCTFGSFNGNPTAMEVFDDYFNVN